MDNICSKCGQEIPKDLKLTAPNPKKVNPEVDPRYSIFLDVLSMGYKSKGWEFGFGAQDGKRLKELLKLRPQWGRDQFRLALRNYFSSEGVVLGDLPRAYLAKLPRYFSGPLDKFGKTAKKMESVATVEEVNRIYAD